MKIDTPKPAKEASCANCWKPLPLCICPETPSLPSKTAFLILQHPREAKNALSTARIVSLSIHPCRHRVGLSWASLNKALGAPAEPKRWAVLFLGSLKETQRLAEDVPFKIVGPKEKTAAPINLEGIVLLDGNWKQSKTLWWRNPWLLKLNRIQLNPRAPSRYSGLRREPRRACLSTVEAAIESLSALGDETIARELQLRFEAFVKKASVYIA